MVAGIHTYKDAASQVPSCTEPEHGQVYESYACFHFNLPIRHTVITVFNVSTTVNIVLTASLGFPAAYASKSFSTVVLVFNEFWMAIAALHVFVCVGTRRFAMRIVSGDLCVTSFIADVSGADWSRRTPRSS